jgi:hypothetical protein
MAKAADTNATANSTAWAIAIQRQQQRQRLTASPAKNLAGVPAVAPGKGGRNERNGKSKRSLCGAVGSRRLVNFDDASALDDG